MLQQSLLEKYAEWLLSPRTKVTVTWSRVTSPQSHQIGPARISWQPVNSLEHVNKPGPNLAKPNPNQPLDSCTLIIMTCSEQLSFGDGFLHNVIMPIHK